MINREAVMWPWAWFRVPCSGPEFTSHPGWGWSPLSFSCCLKKPAFVACRRDLESGQSGGLGWVVWKCISE